MANFSFAIKMAIILFPLVALLFTVPYILYQYHKYGSVNYLRTIIIYSFILYMMSAYFLIILPLPSLEYVNSLKMPSYNFQPFLFIHDIIHNTGLNIHDFATYFPTLKNPVFYEAVFNVCLTIPFGIYLHYYFNCNFKKTLLFSFFLTLFFEITQLTGLYFIYPRAYRVFDVDDLILNTLGGILGYLVAFLFLKILPTREEIDKKSYQKGESISLSKRVVCILIDAFLFFFLMFFTGFFIYMTSLSKVWLIMPIILYFSIILIFKRTVGMNLLNLEFTSFKKDKVTRGSFFLYYFLSFTLYIVLPIIFALLFYLLFKMNIILKTAFEYSLVVIFALTLMIYIISILKRIFHLKMSYELLSGIMLVSTIKSS